MDNTQKQLHDLINASTLPDEDKKMFIEFLVNFSDEEITNMTEMFNDNPQEIIPFWTVLASKMTIISLVKSDDNFSDEDTAKIINQIIFMSDDEFNAFIYGMEEMKASANPEGTLKTLVKEQKQSHEEFMTQSKDFLKKLRDSHKELQEERDEDDYEDALEKINSLKS